VGKAQSRHDKCGDEELQELKPVIEKREGWI
jgi:hypothetical protein